uniref:AlkB homolog 2, alpha-ketoglutarate-dependent dioxygenase n=1 Tax=Echeneis naucrates TaxID=173247 RepID=A0A665UUD8_ECHNA
MEKFVIRAQNKRSETLRRSPRKKIKLEEGERMKEEEDEVDEDAALVEFSHPVPWQKIEAEGLDCDYALLFSKEEADQLFKQLEEQVVYSTGTTTIFFSLQRSTQLITYDCFCFRGGSKSTGVWKSVQNTKKAGNIWRCRSNVHLLWSDSFSLYKDGQDHMGEHRDDEKELDPICPIASVSLGAARDFIFRHRDARGKQSSRQIEPVRLELAHGSLLLMNPPTNTFWYHSLPVRKKVLLPRINLTFRRIVLGSKK